MTAFPLITLLNAVCSTKSLFSTTLPFTGQRSVYKAPRTKEQMRLLENKAKTMKEQ